MIRHKLLLTAFSILLPSFVVGQETDAPTTSELSGPGTIEGQLFDAETAGTISGATVILQLQGGSVDDEKIGVSDATGSFSFESLAPGSYDLQFSKSGYRPGVLRDVVVNPGETTRADFPLPPAPVGVSEEVYNLEVFEASAELISQQGIAFDELRRQANASVDLLSGEDFSRYGVGDVGEAIQRIPGVTVQGGQFAVIRGLNERYSSTLLNGAPVPSPDPDRQSVPLDLFPSSIVSNLLISKSATGDLPGNSSGGSINILTTSFTDEDFEAKLSAKVGFNTNSQDRYISAEGRPTFNVDLNNLGENVLEAERALAEGVITGKEKSVPLDRSYDLEIGGNVDLGGGRLRYFATFGQEWDYNSRLGYEQQRFAEPADVRVTGNPPVFRIRGDGDFALGEMTWYGPSYNTTASSVDEVISGLVVLEYEFDSEGKHAIDYTGFYVNVDASKATLWDNGNFLSLSDSSTINPDHLRYFFDEFVETELNMSFEEFQDFRFWESNVVDEERELEAHQIGGRNEWDLPNDKTFELHWQVSHSETSQFEDNSFTSSGFRLPDGTFHAANNTDFDSLFLPTTSWRETDESQDFGRVDFTFKHEDEDSISYSISNGLFIEDTSREIKQELFRYNLSGLPLNSSTINDSYDTRDEAVAGNYANVNTNDLGSAVEIESSRRIDAYYAKVGLKFWDKVEVTPGVRFEQIHLITQTGLGNFYNFELLRKSSIAGAAVPTTAVTNAAILNLAGPLPVDYVGEIDEQKVLPSLNVAIDITDEARLLMGYSQTVARPSFKEFAYVTTRDPVSLEYTSGNPTLELSPVESFDIRFEYVPEGSGDLFAASVFKKTVEKPIEKTRLVGLVPTNVFFNNPNDADIFGVEFEARKNLAFLGADFWEYFSVGGNFTHIAASVEVPQNFKDLLGEGFVYTNDAGREVRRGGGFYATEGPTAVTGDIGEVDSSRPLFDQPEWIFNADIRFDHEDWGTRITVSYFAQSDVLDSSAYFDIAQDIAVPDRYRLSYEELNFTFSQRITDIFTVGFSAKNLTNSSRGIVYDKELIDSSLKEREYTVGRSYSISVTATF